VRIRVYVHSETHGFLQNVIVNGQWDTGAGQGCTTNRFGYCEMSVVGIPLTVGSRTFTITSLSASGRVYLTAANHDPDGDSNGTTITVNRP
jgi:hypothetical protein